MFNEMMQFCLAYEIMAIESDLGDVVVTDHPNDCNKIWVLLPDCRYSDDTVIPGLFFDHNITAQKAAELLAAHVDFCSQF
jgi:hypothetical protein